MTITTERRHDPLLIPTRTDQQVGQGQAADATRGDASVDDASPVRGSGERGDWVARGDDENSPCDCATPDAPSTARGPVDTIGSGIAPTPGKRDDESLRGDSKARPGIGLAKRPGIDSVQDAGGVTDHYTTRALLTKNLELTGAGENEQLKIRIGDSTYTTGQLRYELDQNPTRFEDFLRTNGISVAEFNEIIDDVNAGKPKPGTTIDLREGSAIAKQYKIGGKDGAVVDSHLDRDATIRDAAKYKSITHDVGLRGEKVKGPSALDLIGGAILEGIAWIARLVCIPWNPDTIIGNGEVNDAHFRGVGEKAAKGKEGIALYALLETHGGEAQLRGELLKQKPSGPTDKQWRRAVDDYIAGAKIGFAAEIKAGRLPATMSHSDAGNALLYMRAHNFSSSSRKDVALVMQQPEAVRGPALKLLAELPETERKRMLDLFTAPPPPPEDGEMSVYTEHAVREQYTGTETTDAQRTAMFEVFRRDGFRTSLGSSEIGNVSDAVRDANNVPKALRGRYLALLPKLGIERAHLASGTNGVAKQLETAHSIADGKRILDDVEARLPSSRDVARTLGARGTEVVVQGATRGTITDKKEQAKIVDAFDSNNVRFRFQPPTGSALVISAKGNGKDEVSLEQYFSDKTYRDDVLRRTGMDRAAFEGLLGTVSGSLRRTPNAREAERARDDIASDRRLLADPNTSLVDREDAQSRIRHAELTLEVRASAANVEIDISPGSKLHELFDLSNGKAPTAAQRLTEESILENQGTEVSVHIKGRGRGAKAYDISYADMVKLMKSPGEGKTRQQAFEAKYPGLDYRETIQAFSKLGDLNWNGGLPESTAPDGSLRVDFTKPQKDKKLEAIRKTLVDSIDDNTRSGPLRFTIGARTTSDRSDTAHLINDNKVGGAAGNQWFQYGFFNIKGYDATKFADKNAKAAFDKNGKRPDPAIALGAVLGIDDYKAKQPHKEGLHEERGVAHGHTDDFMVDPRTGARAEGRDLQVVTFSGRGSSTDRTAFKASSARVGEMFSKYGGVPNAQIEHHHDPSPERMYRAIEGEILKDPRNATDRVDAEGRTRPRTVVVHFAGHTTSWAGDRDVNGFMLTGPDGKSVEFTPDRVRELNRLAKEQGVNIVWVADACRGGEYVGQGRDMNIAELDAAGKLPPDVRQLARLREGNLAQHNVLSELDDMKKIAKPMPKAEDLAELGSRALKGGKDSDALKKLHDRRDAVVAKLGPDAPESRLIERYVQAIDLTIESRDALKGTPGLDSILSNEMITGATRWHRGDAWMTRHYGVLEDKITSELRARLPATPIVPRDSDRKPAVVP